MAEVSESPADKVIRLFGGVQALAKLLGVSRVQVWRWSEDKLASGLGGRIPLRHHAPILEAARARGFTLTYEDLNPPDMPPLGKPGPKPKTSEAA